MIINGKALLKAAPIKDMIPDKQRAHGVSYGLSEVGYDIRIKQGVYFSPPQPRTFAVLQRTMPTLDSHSYSSWCQQMDMAFFGFTVVYSEDKEIITIGRTALASSIEEFDIPSELWCEFRNKSTHARRFLDATIGTDGEPGWQGFLTIEMIFHANEPFEIKAGSGILKAVFHTLTEEAQYKGGYQNQEDKPVPAKLI